MTLLQALQSMAQLVIAFVTTLVPFVVILGGIYLVVVRPLKAQLAEIIERLERIEKDRR